MKNLVSLCVVLALTFANVLPIYAIVETTMVNTEAVANVTLEKLDAEIVASAALLMDQETGTVLYAKNENEKMYPASMTKVLTALVALDYLKVGETVVCGNEIYKVPDDSSKAGHFVGESIEVENLIRGLIIPSGNETANVVAANVAAIVQKNTPLTYDKAQMIFAGLMNEKAKSLGATNSNFVNPHGYHDDNHYTTAHDLALICRAAMENPTIKKIAAETQFIGNGAGSAPDPILKTQLYEWNSHNLLISEGQYKYQYATGLKTGYTGEAGYCLAATATKGDFSEIAIIFNSTEFGRLTAAKDMFEYGFSAYAYREVQKPGEEIAQVNLYNSQLGDDATLKLFAQNDYKRFATEEEIAQITRKITYNEALFPPKDIETTGVTLMAPIAIGDELARVAYFLGEEEVFSYPLKAEKEVLARTFKSDMKYYTDKAKAAAFSVKAIPFWVGGIVLIVVIVLIIRAIRNRRNRNSYRLRKRY